MICFAPRRVTVATLMMALLAATGLLPGDEPSGDTTINSPDSHQTFAAGSEKSHSWLNLGGALALRIVFTNDPYVDINNPRQYDDFIFSFPQITLDAASGTFYYHAERAAAPVAVATLKHGFFGPSVRLLPTAALGVSDRHGLVQTYLVVGRAAQN